MQLGAAGKALIQSFEQCRLTAYRDPNGIWTIGWGHTPAVPGQTCTQDQADAWFLTDIGVACRAITRLVDVALNQNQFDALVSFTFNVGVGNFSSSTLLRYVNGSVPAAADEFLRWDHVNGIVEPGLLRRRQAERELFLTPV